MLTAEGVIRGVIVLSTLGAALVYVQLARLPRLAGASIGVAAVTAAIAMRNRRWAAAAAMSLAYIAPMVVAWLFVPSFPPHAIIWTFALLGVVLVARPHRWAAPARFALPLSIWGLTIALAWPLVAGREMDFTLASIESFRTVNSAGGGPARVVCLWIAGVALALGLGMLWFDWLHDAYGGVRLRDFHRFVVLPLATGWALAMAIGAYQLFVDLSFLNRTFWLALGRAGGPLGDANAFGMIAALWCGPLLALALTYRDRRVVTAVVVGVAMSLVGVWVSGSRTALLVYASGPLGLAAGVIRRPPPMSTRRWAAAGIGVALIASALVVAVRNPSGPVRRLMDTLPAAEPAAIAAFARRLWDRDGYGTVSERMIEEFPLVGVGLGSFHHLVADFSFVVPARLPPDNAQNWYRHNLAEFGLLGSAGWLLWIAAIIPPLVVWRAVPGQEWAAAALRGTLAGFGAASFLGMPGQDFAVAFTVWTLIFWMLQIVRAPQAPTRRRPWLLLLLMAIVVGHTVGTAYAALHELRVAHRARRFGFEYAYGIYRDTPGSLTFLRTGRTAVIVPKATRPWLKLTVSVSHPDADARPVHARVRADGVMLLDERLRRNVDTTRYAPVRASRQRVVIETEVDRTFRWRDYGGDDDRQMGLTMRIDFVAAPPLEDGLRPRPM